MSPSSWRCFVGLAALGLLIGCSGGGSADVGAVSVSGTVTLDGQPVEGATVAFSPAGQEGRSATGKTDASGKFTLTTVEAGDGAVPGSYAVVVTKITGGATMQDPRGQGGELTPEQQEAIKAAAQGKTPEAKNELPEKYAAANTSGLTADVAGSGSNEFTFDLKSE